MFQLYRGGQFYLRSKPEYLEKSTDLAQVTQLYIMVVVSIWGIYYHDLITSLRSEVCAHFHVFKSVAYLRYLTVSDYPLGIFTLSLIQGPGWLNELVVGIPNNSDKPITNTAWDCAPLCKLQKRCTQLAAGSDKAYQLLAHERVVAYIWQIKVDTLLWIKL
jgi:hypothetical protein